jgi:hypothetical protein
MPKVALAAIVPSYSGGTATESHRLPYYPARIGDPRQAPSFCLDFSLPAYGEQAADSV